MIKSASVLLGLLVAAAAVPAAAQGTGLPAGGHWVVLAETSDLDEGAGIALAYRWWFETVGVVEDASGLAVIGGPFADAAGAEAALTDALQFGEWPQDSFVAAGEAFGATRWSVVPPGVRSFEYWDGDEPRIATERFEIEMSSRFDDEDAVLKPWLTLIENGDAVHEATVEESGTTGAFARIRIAALDPDAPAPQVVFSAYTMGAHCCTVTKVLTRDAESWSEIEAGWQDGDEGYRFDDIDGDGRYEMIANDDRFLYAFAPYAASWSPVRVWTLDGETLSDVSHDPAYVGHHRRELMRFEHRADLDPGLWSENGFLAGWVAVKALLGEREAAWAHMLAHYNDDGFWNNTVCDAEPVDGQCPEDQSRSTGFPEALEYHLRQTGYW